MRLAAQLEVKERLASVVKSVNSGAVSSRVRASYDDVKEELASSSTSIRKLRCDVLTADVGLPNITYDAILTRAHLHDAFDSYKKAHQATYDSLGKDRSSELYNAFIAEQRAKACGATDERPFDAQFVDSRVALLTCL